MHWLFTMDAELPRNYGIFENITVQVPAGTVMNPQSPAAVGIRHAGAIRFNDAVLGCLTRADASTAPAASGGTVIPVVVAQSGELTGRPKVSVLQSLAGGGGATHRGDGADGRDRSLANINNTPTEQGELDVGVRIEKYALRADSGGAGRFRGGAGVIYSFRVLQPGIEIMGRGLERFVFQPWGVQGGQAGAVSRVVLNLGTSDEQELGKIDRIRPRVGDVLTIMTPGGGGYGPAFQRDPGQVLLDVRRGRVSIEGAVRDYGVVINPETEEIDAAATAFERSHVPLDPYNGFGQARALWEQVFDDPSMTEFARLLLEIPTGMRQEIRRNILETVAPGVSTTGPMCLAAEGFDFAAARRIFRTAIAELRNRRAGPASNPAVGL
jgi:N-methylhydantoinase B